MYKARALNEGVLTYNSCWSSLFDGPLLLQVNLPVVDTIHPQSSKFVTGVKIKATYESLV